MSEVAAALRELSEPRERGEKIGQVIGRAARRAGLPYWRTFDIWYGKARRVEDRERTAIAAALDKKRREAARNELHELRTRLTRLESLLAQSDPDFHRESLAQTRQHLRTLDGKSGA